jgi:hypothetical protein
VHVVSVIFNASKEGYADREWEDGAAAGARDWEPDAGASAFRFAVADGATETYESRRWVNQLLSSFVSAAAATGAGEPGLDAMQLHGWLKQMQDQWQLTVSGGTDYIERMKIRQGTLATFVGGQILGLNTGTPFFSAVAAGDSVMFHVRQGRLVGHFPPLRAADFASAPDGLSTLPERLDRITDQMLSHRGYLEEGDLIFIATDAFAKWIISSLERGNEHVWPKLAGLVHPDDFCRLVASQRQVKAMKDDDVTLMRLRLVPAAPTTVLVCL